MGAVTFSLDHNLLTFLHQNINFEAFIETGTYLGDTVDSVHQLFNQVISIELSSKYYQQAKNRFESQSHIKILQGNSPIILQQINQEIDFVKYPILFWLDAHWCASEGTAGQESQCPLLEELSAIKSIHPHSFILIDDARYFLSAPNKPNEYSQWPCFEDILVKLRLLSNVHEVMVFNDVIIYYPRKIRIPLLEFTHNYGIDWLLILDKAKNYDNLLADNIDKENMINYIYGEAEKRIHIIEELDLNLKQKVQEIENLKLTIDNLKKIN